MNSWARYHIGHYRETEKFAEEGFVRTVGEAPSLALHCLRWRAQARFRLGDWNLVGDDYRLARRLLDEHKDVPPHYVSPMFGTAALVHELRGEHAAADAILELLRRGYEGSAPEDRDTLPLSEWAEFVAPILARRGRVPDARELIDSTLWRRKGRLGLLLEAAMDVAVEAGDWEWAEDLVPRARALSTEYRLEALEAAADATAGRVALATGDPDRAIEILARAVAAFAGLSADWDCARTEVHLAQALIDRGRPAAEILEHAVTVLERVGARREIDTARDLRETGP
jgi:tetratricopeptide (TPR) repeat protein